VIHADSHGVTTCDGGACRAVVVFGTYLSLGIDGQSEEEKAALTGGDLRIRDIVYLLNPEDSQTILDPSHEVSIVGEMDDGDPDAVPFLVQVDGILAENGADALLHVAVDYINHRTREYQDDV
jgi:hypothetical protein